MDDRSFPPNSHISKDDSVDKQLAQVTSGTVIRRKKSFGSKLKDTFIQGDLKTAIRYAASDIVIPMISDMLYEASTGALQKLFLGENRRRIGSTTPYHGSSGVIDYSKIARGPMGAASHMASSARAMSRMARARHDFDAIVIESRGEAEDVVSQLMEIVSKYGEATVADLYQLVGVTPAHTDHKWGWKNLTGAGVSRDRHGYVLDLPEPDAI